MGAIILIIAVLTVLSLVLRMGLGRWTSLSPLHGNLVAIFAIPTGIAILYLIIGPGADSADEIVAVAGIVLFQLIANGIAVGLGAMASD